MTKKTEDYAKYFQTPDMKAGKKRTRQDVEVIYNAADIDESMQGIGKNKTYFIRTYGCQMNDHDTEVMAGILENLQFTKVDDVNVADVVIFNTCAIRENAENKVLGEISRLKPLKQKNPDKIFAVCGCMSQEEGIVNRLLEKYPMVDMIFGTHNIHRLAELLKGAMFDKERVVEVWSKEGEIIEDLPKVRDSKTKAWVNIIYGCDKFCTYCIVPFTRGKERSRHHEDILEELTGLYEDGYKEVTLLGQNVNAYGKDLNTDYLMGHLLEDVAKIGFERIRFTTSHPWDFDDYMIDIIGKYQNIMPSIHLPVQSGNDAILKIMGRSYNRNSYLELVRKLKAVRNDLIFTTDIIVGYPNETEEQFLDTLSIYEEVKYDTAFAFIYSPREGTPAAKMDDNVPMEVKKDRLKQLQEVIVKYQKENNLRYQDKIVKVLVDGKSNKNAELMVGYTEDMKLVLFKADETVIDQIVNVQINECRQHNLKGTLVE